MSNCKRSLFVAEWMADLEHDDARWLGLAVARLEVEEEVPAQLAPPLRRDWDADMWAVFDNA